MSKAGSDACSFFEASVSGSFVNESHFRQGSAQQGSDSKVAEHQASVNEGAYDMPYSVGEHVDSSPAVDKASDVHCSHILCTRWNRKGGVIPQHFGERCLGQTDVCTAVGKRSFCKGVDQGVGETARISEGRPCTLCAVREAVAKAVYSKGCHRESIVEASDAEARF